MDQISSLNAKNTNCGSEQEQYTSIVDEFESRLVVGERITNPEDAYLLYYEYGRAKGFSIRKWKQAYFHDCSGKLYMKGFDCSCNGTKDEKRNVRNKQPIYQKMEQELNEEWRVIIFDIEHNHDMVASDQRYMLRSARNISFAKGDTLKALVDARFSIANAYSYMQQESHRREYVGFLKKDAYDYLNRLTKDHRQDFQVDKNNRMCNFIFRDGRYRIDYETFGDVLSIDTTYKINKYNLICAPFTGINHHMHNVMFRLAFMFKTMFHKFMEFCESKEEFEDMWSKIIVDYNLYDHSWLNNMYRLRHKWSTIFATSRSEGTNSTLKDSGKRMHTLFECFLRFERENDFKCRHGMPTVVVRANYLLRDDVAIYTHSIYNMFQS
ncbi:hypothetical protein Pfo_022633 [Paulownia fortunei]|nr:hypothetical protein Pfo_022633 [Paulownia fortunei]